MLRFPNIPLNLVSNSRDEMSRFVTGVSEDSEEECRVAMLHHKMDLCRLMVHAQQVEEIRWRKRGREGKKPRTSNYSCSRSGRSSFRVQDRPKFKKRHQTQVILLLLGTLMPKGTSLTLRRVMIEMPSVTESREVKGVVCMKASAW